MDKKRLKIIEGFGNQYIEKYLNVDKDILIHDWWEGLKFFFGRSFYRGRNDKLSNEYRLFTINVLEDFININNNNLDAAYKKLCQSKNYFEKEKILELKKIKDRKKRKEETEKLSKKNPVYKIFKKEREITVEWDGKKYNKDIHLGNDEDIMMVFDVLKFITEKEEQKNIYKYIYDCLSLNKTNEIYKKLVSKDFRSIADKIASFIIRDIYLLNPTLPSKGIKFENAFPVDTWVEKVATKLVFNSENGTENKTKNKTEIKSGMIEKCDEYNLNKFKVAAGCWYLGSNSFEILLDNIENIK